MGVGVIWALMVISDRDPAHTSLSQRRDLWDRAAPGTRASGPLGCYLLPLLPLLPACLLGDISQQEPGFLSVAGRRTTGNPRFSHFLLLGPKGKGILSALLGRISLGWVTWSSRTNCCDWSVGLGPQVYCCECSQVEQYLFLEIKQ